MAVAGDVAKVTVSATYLGQVCQNVFFYRIQDAPTEGWKTGLASEFALQVLTEIRALQVDTYQYTGLQVINLFNAADLLEVPLTVAGTVAAATSVLLPSYVSLSFKLNRANALVRNGRKQIGGLMDGQIDGNNLTAAYVTAANDAAAAMALTLNPGLGVDVFIPVIVGRVGYTTSEGNDAYRLPESQAEMGANWSPISSAQFVRPSTMNSRKVGHGI